MSDWKAAWTRLVMPQFWLDKYTPPPPPEPFLTAGQRHNVDTMGREIKRLEELLKPARQTVTIEAAWSLGCDPQYMVTLLDALCGEIARSIDQLRRAELLLAMDSLPDVRFMPIEEVLKVSGLGRTTLYEEIDGERFPGQVQLAARRVGWPDFEVKAWVYKKIKEREERKRRKEAAEVSKRRG